MASDDDLALQYVGFTDEFVRAVESKYADQARNDFPRYVVRTLSYNQQAGGRYNPPCEFGALYTASDEDTAWAELHARLAREGIPGLPSTMGLIGIAVSAGRYADLGDAEVHDAWGVSLETLQAEVPTPAQQAACHGLGRDVRVVADFLRAPSARADGDNIPLFIGGRDGSELAYELQFVDSRRSTPRHLRQHPGETWE